MNPNPKFWWEDFHVHQVIDCGQVTPTADEIVRFARDFDPQSFHIDADAARHSPYGGLIASGWHTCSMAMRLMCDAYLNDSSSVGSPGVENIRWLKPVRPGDTLSLTMRVVEARPLNSRPEIGVVVSKWEMRNQRDEVAMTMEGTGMFRRRETA